MKKMSSVVNNTFFLISLREELKFKVAARAQTNVGTAVSGNQKPYPSFKTSKGFKGRKWWWKCSGFKLVEMQFPLETVLWPYLPSVP